MKTLCILMLALLPSAVFAAAAAPTGSHLQQRFAAQPRGGPDTFQQWLEAKAGAQTIEFLPTSAVKDLDRYLPLLVHLKNTSRSVIMPLALRIGVGEQLAAQPVGVINYLLETGTPATEVCPIPYIEEWGMMEESEREWYQRAEVVLAQFRMVDPQREVLRKELLDAVRGNLQKIAAAQPGKAQAE